MSMLVAKIWNILTTKATDFLSLVFSMNTSPIVQNKQSTSGPRLQDWSVKNVKPVKHEVVTKKKKFVVMIKESKSGQPLSKF